MNDFDYDPTDADLLAQDDVDDTDTVQDDDDLDYGYAARDDRYDSTGRAGMPSWSLFA